MAKILIIADIHANIQALEAVLEATSQHSLDAIYCAGDIVGYGSHPNECVDLMRELNAICIRGNHERFVLGIDDGESFNSRAYDSGVWTKGVLTPDNLEYLSSLPDERHLEDGTIIAHGAPGDPDQYLFGSWEIQELAAELEAEAGPGLCILGHTHIAILSTSDHTEQPDSAILAYDSTRRVLINPGSVGEPRDWGRPAAHVLLDTDGPEVLYNRITL